MKTQTFVAYSRVTAIVLALITTCACSSEATLSKRIKFNVAMALADSVNQLEAFGEYVDPDSVYANDDCQNIGIGVLGNDDFKECGSVGRGLSEKEIENRTLILRAQIEQEKNHPNGGLDCLEDAFRRRARYYVAHDFYLQNELVVSELFRVYYDDYKAGYHYMRSMMVVSRWNMDGSLCRSRVGVIHP